VGSSLIQSSELSGMMLSTAFHSWASDFIGSFRRLAG
jgi:hypothetical protein